MDTLFGWFLIMNRISIEFWDETKGFLVSRTASFSSDASSYEQHLSPHPNAKVQVDSTDEANLNIVILRDYFNQYSTGIIKLENIF